MNKIIKKMIVLMAFCIVFLSLNITTYAATSKTLYASNTSSSANYTSVMYVLTKSDDATLFTISATNNSTNALSKVKSIEVSYTMLISLENASGGTTYKYVNCSDYVYNPNGLGSYSTYTMSKAVDSFNYYIDGQNYVGFSIRMVANINIKTTFTDGTVVTNTCEMLER